MFDDPVEQSFLESNVVPGLFALDPLMPKDLFALGKKLFVKERLLDEFRAIVGSGVHRQGNFHISESSVNALNGCILQRCPFGRNSRPGIHIPQGVTV